MIRRRILLNSEKKNKKLYLYNYGDECTSLTGGWPPNKFYSKRYGQMYNDEIVKESDHLHFDSRLHTSWNWGWSVIGCLNPINTVGYSKLCWLTQANAYENMKPSLRITNGYDFDNGSYAQLTCAPNGASQYNPESKEWIDLSERQGNYYICIADTSGASTSLIDVYAVWLE